MLVDTDTTIRCETQNPHDVHGVSPRGLLLMSHMQWQQTSKINLLDDVTVAAELHGQGCQLGLIGAYDCKFYNQHQHVTLGVLGSYVYAFLTSLRL